VAINVPGCPHEFLVVSFAAGAWMHDPHLLRRLWKNAALSSAFSAAFSAAALSAAAFAAAALSAFALAASAFQSLFRSARGTHALGAMQWRPSRRVVACNQEARGLAKGGREDGKAVRGSGGSSALSEDDGVGRRRGATECY